MLGTNAGSSDLEFEVSKCTAAVEDRLNSSYAEQFLHYLSHFTAVAASRCIFLLFLGGIVAAVTEKNDRNTTRCSFLGGH